MRVAKYNTLLPYAHLVMQCPSCGHEGLQVEPEHDQLSCSACAVTFPGLAGVPDLAPGQADGGGMLRRVTGWQRTASWARKVARPRMERWASGQSDEVREAWVSSWLRPADGPVLDLCTGSGHSASEVARWMGAGRVIGVDGSLTLLEQTQASPRDPGLAYVRAADGALPFKSGSIGAVQAMSGLHQASEPLALVAEVGRVLATDGSFVGTVHVDEGPTGMQWVVRALGEPPVAREAFTQAVHAAGMEMVGLHIAGITAFFAARKR